MEGLSTGLTLVFPLSSTLFLDMFLVSFQVTSFEIFCHTWNIRVVFHLCVTVDAALSYLLE